MDDEIAAYARKQATLQNPLTPATGPFLVIKAVPGDTRNRPQNLIWGHMYDPDQRYLWNQKYGTFGLNGERSRIRCGVCGARKIPQALTNGGRCDACNERFWKDYVPKVSHRKPEWNDRDLYYPGMYRPLERGC